MAELPEARVVKDGGGAERARTGGEPPPHLLRLAPRAVPRQLVWRLWFGTSLAKIGWFFAGVGMVFTFVFLPRSELLAPDYDRSGTATIIGVEATNSSENDEAIYRVDYTFTDDDGVARTGASYTKDSSVRGDHPVEYLADDPGKSRLVGMRSRPFGWWVVFVLLFPIVGLGMAIPQLVAGHRATRLLRFGVETHGTLLVKKATSVTVDNMSIMALTFEYQVGGRPYRTTVKTLETSMLEDDAQEPMIYDPQDPSRATTLDHLPGSPKISADGEIASLPGYAFLLLVMPVVTTALIFQTVAILALR